MYYTGVVNRKMLKEQSKDWMRRAQPAVWLVALVYMLAVNLIPNVINSLTPYTVEMSKILAYVEMGDTYTAMSMLTDILTSPAGYLMLFVSIAVSLFTSVVGWGYTSYSLGVIRGENPGYGEMFSRFYMAGKIILALILETVYVFLWSLLFVIPGIVAAYRYRMVVYVLLDDPDCHVGEAFQRSKLLMLGRKKELFMLDLSFFGWLLLAELVVMLPSTLFGISMVAATLERVLAIVVNLLLMPYQEFTFAGWYEAIRPKEVKQEGPQADPFS